jgi:hypothetical protein
MGKYGKSKKNLKIVKGITEFQTEKNTIVVA